MKGIITIKDQYLQEYIQSNFPDWVVLVTRTPTTEINYYPLPKQD